MMVKESYPWNSHVYWETTCYKMYQFFSFSQVQIVKSFSPFQNHFPSQFFTFHQPNDFDSLIDLTLCHGIWIARGSDLFQMQHDKLFFLQMKEPIWGLS